MAVVFIIMVIGGFVLMWNSVKYKGKSIKSQPNPNTQASVIPPSFKNSVLGKEIEAKEKEAKEKEQIDKLLEDVVFLFNTSLSKYGLKEDMVNLTCVGVQHHYLKFDHYIHDFSCGTIERQPSNPRDKRAIRFADIEGNTIGHIPKRNLKEVYKMFGEDFEPRPFFGKILPHPDGKDIFIMFAITYGNNLQDEKIGTTKNVMEHIDGFIKSRFDYYDGVN